MEQYVIKGGNPLSGEVNIIGAKNAALAIIAAAIMADETVTIDNVPELTLYSNLTGEVYPSQKEQIIETVSKQASNSVRWENTIRNMAADGVDTFIEVGAGTTLSGLVKRTLTDVRVFNVCDMATLEETVKNI